MKKKLLILLFAMALWPYSFGAVEKGTASKKEAKKTEEKTASDAANKKEENATDKEKSGNEKAKSAETQEAVAGDQKEDAQDEGDLEEEEEGEYQEDEAYDGDEEYYDEDDEEYEEYEDDQEGDEPQRKRGATFGRRVKSGGKGIHLLDENDPRIQRANVKKVVDVILKAEGKCSPTLSEIFGKLLNKVKIPPFAKPFFDKSLRLCDVKAISSARIDELAVGVGVEGKTKIGNLSVDTEIYFGYTEDGEANLIYILEMPGSWKLSNISSKFKKLDIVSLSESKLIITTMPYYESGMGLAIGLNYLGELNLQKGPLKIIYEIQKAASRIPGINADLARPIYLGGHIPLDFSQLTFKAILPMSLGIDFTKIKQTAKTVAKVIQTINSEDLLLQTTIPEVSFTVENGVTIKIASQQKPLTFVMGGTVRPTEFSVHGQMQGLLELFWLHLGNASFELNFDPVVMATLETPISGMGLGGEIQLGTEKNDKAKLALEGGFKLSASSKTVAAFSLHGTAANIKFSHLTNFVSKVTKTKVPDKVIPPINIKKLSGSFFMEGPETGFTTDNEIEVFGISGGLQLEFLLRKKILSGAMYLSPITLKVKDTTLLQVTGAGRDKKLGTEDDALNGSIELDLTNPHKAKFALDGYMEIPPLKLKGQGDIEVAGQKFKAEFASKFQGVFDVIAVAQFNPTNPLSTLLSLKFKQNFIDLIVKEVVDKIKLKKVDIEKQIRTAQKGISDARKSVNKEMMGKLKGLEQKRDAARAKCGKNVAEAALTCPLGQIKAVIDKVAKELGVPVADAAKKVGGWIGKGGDKVVDAAQQAGKGVVTAGESVKSALAKINQENVKKAAGDAKKAAEDAAKQAAETAQKAAQEAKQVADQAIAEARKVAAEAKRIAENVAREIQSAAKDAAEKAKAAGEAVGGGLKKAGKTVGGWFGL